MEARSAEHWLASSKGLAWVRGRIEQSAGLSRFRLAREVCEHLEWRDAAGRLKEMACRKRLVRLARRGVLMLPQAKRVPPQRSRQAETPAALPQFDGTLADLGSIELQAVFGGTAASRQWNALMAAHHPQGSGPLCGAQLRYLIVSRVVGVVGGLSVSAAGRARPMAGLE
jgi:hypothetical protein